MRAYSLGMKQRLGLAVALLCPRELLVLDEPTNGLDPQGTREVRSLVRSLAAGGTTVFVSSHLLAEVEQMCTHVGVMSAGALVAQGSLEDAAPRRPGAAAAAHPRRRGRPARARPARRGARRRARPAPDGDGAALVTAPLPEHAPAPETIVAALVGAGVRVRGFAVAEASLEERFVALTGEGFDVAQ